MRKNFKFFALLLSYNLIAWSWTALSCASSKNIQIPVATFDNLMPISQINTPNDAARALIIAQDFRFASIIKIKKNATSENVNNARRYDDEFRNLWKALKAETDVWKQTNTRPAQFDYNYGFLMLDARQLDIFAGNEVVPVGAH